MRYLIIRDDDTNALTPVACLERLYRPFLERGLRVNLSTIPAVATDTRTADGALEGYLNYRNGARGETAAIGDNPRLVRYLLDNPGYHVVQHGWHHDWLEFDRLPAAEAARRLDDGTRLMLDAGFPQPETFVAPYDRLSRGSLLQVAERFRVLSTGWFELRRLPVSWWPRYVVRQFRDAPHWRIGNTALLSHPGCLLSHNRPRSAMFDAILAQIQARQLTVLVTHWWEYFNNGQPDQPFITVLHELADYLAHHREIKVISFADLAGETVPLN